MDILLVEDDPDHAKIIRQTFERNRIGNVIEHVTDGEQALMYLRGEEAYADRPRPGLILLDLKLPKVDGHQVLSEVKNDPELHTIPVVVLTTSDAERDRLMAYEEKANSYLVKPINFARFRQMVKDLGFYWTIWNRPPAD